MAAPLPTVFPNYGFSKGRPIEGAPLRSLEFYAANARRTLEDPSKAAFHEKDRALLTALEAEITRQGATPSREPPPPLAAEKRLPEVLPNYGIAKGQRIVDADSRALDYYRGNALKSLDDPQKAAFHARDRALLEVLDAEIARRVAAPQTAEPAAPLDLEALGRKVRDSPYVVYLACSAAIAGASEPKQLADLAVKAIDVILEDFDEHGDANADAWGGQTEAFFGKERARFAKLRR